MSITHRYCLNYIFTKIENSGLAYNNYYDVNYLHRELMSIKVTKIKMKNGKKIILFLDSRINN